MKELQRRLNFMNAVYVCGVTGTFCTMWNFVLLNLKLDKILSSDRFKWWKWTPCVKYQRILMQSSHIMPEKPDPQKNYHTKNKR